MELAYVPLLAKQRALYELPRGPERFREYLRTLTDARTGDLALPLVAMNPMGKEHLPVFLDALLALDADGEGARALEAARAALRDVPGSFRACLVVADDLKGGWTDRAASEYSHRFETQALDKRGWITGLLWTSESYTRERVRVELAAALFRAAYVGEHGPARTLREMLAQEAHALGRAAAVPALDAEELAYTAQVLTPLLASDDRPTLIAALFGDAAAKKLGYPPLGVARDAGLAWAASGRAESVLGRPPE